MSVAAVRLSLAAAALAVGAAAPRAQPAALAPPAPSPPAEGVVWSPAPGVVLAAADSAALRALVRPAAVPLGAGVASFYGERFRGRRTANGERFNPDRLTAAHRTLPFGTRVRVTNRRNGRSVVVRINDRGPYAGGRVIDLSKAAARRLGMVRRGIARVRLEKVVR